MNNRKINIGLLSALSALVVLSILLVTNIGNVKEFTHKLLVWPHLTLCFWLVIIICYTIYSFSPVSNNQSQTSLIYGMFGNFADTAFTIGTLGVSGTTSLALLKGIYIQTIIKDEIYFNHFNEIDIYSLSVVSIFLLVYSLRMSLNVLYLSIVNSSAVAAEPTEE
ncbi:MAG: hypothetical protein GKR94_00570 [Gammaproteobacteria bacterium]|nr:hypothetical protein [Gammaproteobacteria bacterium]